MKHAPRPPGWREECSPPPREPILRRGTRVETKDGPGTIVGRHMRRNTNGGPGCHEYVVKLDDHRVRHYSANAVQETKGATTR